MGTIGMLKGIIVGANVSLPILGTVACMKMCLSALVYLVKLPLMEDVTLLRYKEIIFIKMICFSAFSLDYMMVLRWVELLKVLLFLMQILWFVMVLSPLSVKEFVGIPSLGVKFLHLIGKVTLMLLSLGSVHLSLSQLRVIN